MVTYKEFKKLVCLRCLDGPFSMFSKERKLKAVNETITENENVIKERYEGLYGAFGKDLSWMYAMSTRGILPIFCASCGNSLTIYLFL